MSEDTDSDQNPMVPPMNAERKPRSDALGESIDALTDRVNTLAAMVREAAGGIAANRGQVSALDRRLQELTGRGSDQTAADLVALRNELDALRGFIADQPNRQGPITAASSDPLEETITELAGRIDMLGEVVRSTAGRMVGEQNRTSELAGALAQQDARAEARFVEIQQRLAVVSEQAKQALAAPPPEAPDAALEARVNDKVDVLVDRVNFFAETATATAGRAAATDGELTIFKQRSNEALTNLERRSGEALARTEGALRAMRGDLETFNTKIEVDPMLSERMSSLLNSVEALGSRVGTLSGIVGETAGRVAGREVEIAGLDSRIDDVSLRIEGVASQLRAEIHAIVTPTDTASTPADAEARTEALSSNLALLELTLADTAGATEQLGLDLRDEITSLAAAVAQEHHEVVEATRALEERGAALESRLDSLAAFASSSAARGSEEVEALAAAVVRRHAEVLEVTAEWEARRADLERRMDDLTKFAASTAERGADEMSRALTTLAARLERLEHDRQAVASDATFVESSWAEERVALEIRLDEIAASITAEIAPAPDVGRLVDELAGRLARMEDDREAVADLAALAETWTSELASLEARVDQGLATLGENDATSSGSGSDPQVDIELVENVDELAHRIEQIETDRDAVRAELARTATSWGAERAALQERVSELAALIVTGPVRTVATGEVGQSPQELDRLRIGVEGLRMRLAYHEKTVSDLAGSKGVVARLDELGMRLDQLSAIVMAQQSGALPPPGTGQPMPAEPFVGTSGILGRLDEADRLRAQSREKMLEQMEKIATRMDWRLQRLEAAGVTVGAGVNEN